MRRVAAINWRLLRTRERPSSAASQSETIPAIAATESSTVRSCGVTSIIEAASHMPPAIDSTAASTTTHSCSTSEVRVMNRNTTSDTAPTTTAQPRARRETMSRSVVVME